VSAARPVLYCPKRDAVLKEPEHPLTERAATEEPLQTTQPDPSPVKIGISYEVAEKQPLRVSARVRQPGARLTDYILY